MNGGVSNPIPGTGFCAPGLNGGSGYRAGRYGWILCARIEWWRGAHIDLSDSNCRTCNSSSEWGIKEGNNHAGHLEKETEQSLARWIGEIDWITVHIRIGVPALRVRQIDNGSRHIRTHECAVSAGVETGHRVIQSGDGVPS